MLLTQSYVPIVFQLIIWMDQEIVSHVQDLLGDARNVPVYLHAMDVWLVIISIVGVVRCVLLQCWGVHFVMDLPIVWSVNLDIM